VFLPSSCSKSCSSWQHYKWTHCFLFNEFSLTTKHKYGWTYRLSGHCYIRHILYWCKCRTIWYIYIYIYMCVCVCVCVCVCARVSVCACVCVCDANFHLEVSVSSFDWLYRPPRLRMKFSTVCVGEDRNNIFRCAISLPTYRVCASSSINRCYISSTVDTVSLNNNMQSRYLIICKRIKLN
jgi:hypothetical protein